MVDARSLCSIDICFNESGVENTRLILRYIDDFEPLRKLALLLKYLLYSRDLNETYTGGMGSYCLILTIVHFLQMHQQNYALDRVEENIGNLFVDYLEFYGIPLFNYVTTGVSVRLVV